MSNSDEDIGRVDRVANVRVIEKFNYGCLNSVQ